MVGPLTNTETVSLRSARVKTIHVDVYKGFPRFGDRIDPGDHKSFVLMKNIDMTSIRKLSFTYYATQEGTIKARLGSQEGPAIATAPIRTTGEWGSAKETTAEITVPTSGRHDVYFVVLKPEKPNKAFAAIHEIYFQQ